MRMQNNERADTIHRQPLERIVSPYILSPNSMSAFDPISFSKMKFGSLPDIRNFAGKVAENIDPELVSNNTVVAAVEYDYAPAAGVLLAEEVARLLGQKYNVALPFLRIRQRNTPTVDFATLSREERSAYLHTIIYNVVADTVRDKDVIFVDDIRTTGGHEAVARENLGNLPQEVTYAYAVTLDPNSDPRMEQTLTMAAINSIEDIDKIMQGEHFRVTTKLCKYLLAYEQTEDLTRLARMVPPTKLQELYTCMKNSFYNSVPAYAVNTDMLKKLCAN